PTQPLIRGLLLPHQVPHLSSEVPQIGGDFPCPLRVTVYLCFPHIVEVFKESLTVHGLVVTRVANLFVHLISEPLNHVRHTAPPQCGCCRHRFHRGRGREALIS